jgi:hypothetical protein
VRACVARPPPACRPAQRRFPAGIARARTGPSPSEGAVRGERCALELLHMLRGRNVNANSSSTHTSPPIQPAHTRGPCQVCAHNFRRGIPVCEGKQRRARGALRVLPPPLQVAACLRSERTTFADNRARVHAFEVLGGRELIRRPAQTHTSPWYLSSPDAFLSRVLLLIIPFLLSGKKIASPM